VNKTIRKTLLSALLAAASAGAAHAGTLERQGVSFTSSWTGNVLTLEIDAANPTGGWADATTIGALQIKDIGQFSGVELTAAPQGAMDWTLSSSELNANGCAGGSHVGMSLCYSGGHVALADNMVFQFTFTGGDTKLASPHVKVNFFNGDGDKKVGSLLGANIPMAAPVPEPETYAMLLGGLAVMGALARRRNRRR
jgi:hypothetical protein